MNSAGDLRKSIAKLVASKASPSRIVEAVLEAALAARASDVHFEPLDDGLGVRLRLDGVLQDAAALPAELAAPVVARLKVLGRLATYRTDVPQDGRISGEGGDLRLSTYPTVRGEKAVVRLFAHRPEDFRLDDLDLGEEVTATLRGALAAREGLIALTGPAGSGKTTTIYAALAHLGKSESAPRQIVTVEDPVECLLPGVTQTEINPAADLTFSTCLRSVLRQDPEVIMVGEVRDAETAELAVGAALTGHLVITTLHAGTAPGVLARLPEMGVEPHLVAGVVRLAVAQRLVRRMCPDCRSQGGEGWSAPGCEACLGTGFRGRLPVAEALSVTPAARVAVLARADLASLRKAAAQSGMISMVERGGHLVAEGLTSPGELARVLAGIEGLEE